MGLRTESWQTNAISSFAASLKLVPHASVDKTFVSSAKLHIAEPSLGSRFDAQCGEVVGWECTSRQLPWLIIGMWHVVFVIRQVYSFLTELYSSGYFGVERDVWQSEVGKSNVRQQVESCESYRHILYSLISCAVIIMIV